MIPILMLTKDRLELTEQAILAILENTHQQFKLVIYDNGSKEVNQRRLLCLVEGLKAGRDETISVSLAAENKGIHYGMDWFHLHFAYCDFYAKVDNDTVVPEDWLTTLLTCLQCEGADLVGSRHYTFNQSALKAMRLAEMDGFAPFPSPGGSGIVYRRSYVEGRKVSDYAEGMMDGWTRYCHAMWQEGAKSGFCGDIFIELLDMEKHFKRRNGHGSTDEVLGQPHIRG